MTADRRTYVGAGFSRPDRRVATAARACLFVALGLLATACAKPTADQHLQKAKIYAEHSRFPEAIVEYRLALQIDPKRGDIRLKLADAYMTNRDIANARHEYVVAADLLPNDVVAQLQAGNILLQTGAFTDAKSRAEAVLRLDPKSADAQILLGNALAGLKDMDGALEEYQNAIALNPSKDAAYINIGTIQSVRGKLDEAEASFRKAADVAPTSVGARMALANFLWASRQMPEAEQTLKAAVALEPVNLDVNRAIGMFYLASNRANEAEPYFKTIAGTANTTAAAIGLADYYSIVKRYDEARNVLIELAKKAEAYAVATTRLAAIDAAQGNRGHALETLTALLNKHPQDTAARLLMARVLLVDGKRDEALAAATKIVTEDPNGPEAADAYLITGDIQASLDRTEDAVKAYEEVLKRQSRMVDANLALSALYLKTGSIDKAATYADQARYLNPRNPASRVLGVRVLLAKRDMTKAGAELAALRAEFPTSAVVLNLVAAQQIAERQLEAARTSYTRAAELAPADLEALAGLIGLDLAAGRTREATARIDAGMKRLKPTANLFMLAGRTYAAAGDFTRAEELLKRAIDADPARLQAYTLLGSLYVRQRKIDDARAQFQQVIERNPRSTPAGTMLGMLLEAQHRLAEAEQQYQKVLAFDSRAAVAANNLAWLYVAGGRNLNQALQLAQTAQQQLPDEPHVSDTLGWIYYRKNLAASAVPHLESSVQKDPSDPTTHYHLGMAYAQVGKMGQAKKELQRALAFKVSFEGDAEARKALGDISRLSSGLSKAPDGWQF